MRRAVAVLGVAFLASQAGHLLAYELRFGAAAQQLQGSGTHAYFPSMAKTLLGAGAMLLIAALLIIGWARVATGRKIEPESAPSLLRLLAVTYTLQLALFVAQETIEGSRSSEIVLWGFLGQLPVALVGAVALPGCWCVSVLRSPAWASDTGRSCGSRLTRWRCSSGRSLPTWSRVLSPARRSVSEVRPPSSARSLDRTHR